MGFRVWGLEFRLSGLGVRVLARLGFRAEGLKAPYDTSAVARPASTLRTAAAFLRGRTLFRV